MARSGASSSFLALRWLLCLLMGGHQVFCCCGLLLLHEHLLLQRGMCCLLRPLLRTVQDRLPTIWVLEYLLLYL